MGGAAERAPMTVPGELRIRVLGTLEVDGVDGRDLGSRKARVLLTALAVARGRPVGLDTLVEVLWGDDPPANPHEQLSVLASRLRRALGRERVVRRDAGLALVADWIDLIELTDRADEAAARLAAGNPMAAVTAAAAALDLVRGPLAAEVDTAWFAGERLAAEREVARARMLMADAALARGDPATAAAAADRALDHDPYDEVALRALMRAHVGAGRPASALAAYARVRERLRDDLGVDPTAETEELHTAVVRGEITTAAAPPPPNELVGRTRELEALDSARRRAASGTPVGIVVEGEAGIGKSALVAAFAGNARAAGSAVLVGRCDQLGRDLPLQPILDALDAHGAGPVEAPEGPQVTTMPDVEAGRLLLFRSLLERVARLAETQVVVLVVEDVHLAGAATVEWLQLALRRPARLLVVATRRPEGSVLAELAGAERLDLGPLDLDAVRQLVGADRADVLLARSGGHPLLLIELAAAPDGALPSSISAAVAGRTAALGEEAAAAILAAAVLGPVVDLDLLASVLRRPAGELLDLLERAQEARLLVEEEGGIRFAHDLVREALVESASGSRRAYLHREAAAALAARTGADPVRVAWHARLGGDDTMTARWLVQAAERTAARFDAAEADRLLTNAIGLADSAPARMARARVRLAMWQMDAARDDAERAIALGGGVAALELAGWVAYYRRDHDQARRYADEGVARTADPGLRASCLALAGRCRHSRGDLAGAAARLEESVRVAPPEVRPMGQIWLAGVRLHQGAPAETDELAAAALVDPGAISHPFAPLHARFARACALGLLGRPLDALEELARMEAAADEAGAPGRRFEAVTANVRGWVLRAVGRFEEADECNVAAADLPAEPMHDEPRYVGHLDLVETRLMLGDAGGASALLDAIADIDRWDGTMAWRQQGRHRLARARVALLEGDAATATDLAIAVATEAEAAGSRRYAVFGRLVAARATAVRGEAVDLDAVAADLRALDDVAGLEGWWVTAEVAAACRVDAWWHDAERRAGALAAVAGEHEAPLRDAVAARLTRVRR